MHQQLKNCIIRDLKKEDAKSLALHADDRTIWRNLPDRFPNPYTAKDARSFIRFVLKQQPPLEFAIEVDGQAAGAIAIRMGSDVYRRSAEIGFWLGSEFRGRGIVTEAATFITEWAFTNLDLNRIEALVFESNLASIGVLKKLAKIGYKREACLENKVIKDGQTCNLIIYSCLRPH